MLLTPQISPTFQRRLQGELALVEARFAAELVSDLACVNALVGHVERYRGKMLRPTLVLAGGLACLPPGQGLSEAHRVVAAVVEMVHMATLVHDDILDEAQVRRQGATVNELAGNETAVMLGDYLISHAYHLCSSLGRTDVSRCIAHCTNTVCEGELLQLANRNNWALDEATYQEIIRRKTASLCGSCCRLGAVLAGRPNAEADGLYDYGEKLGTAFQIIDDVLDLVGDPATVGKSLGRDLAKGKLTLPLIHFLREGPADRRRWLGDLLASAAAGSDAADWSRWTGRLVDDLEAAGSMRYARRRAGDLVAGARAAVAGLPSDAGVAALAEIADAVLAREA